MHNISQGKKISGLFLFYPIELRYISTSVYDDRLARPDIDLYPRHQSSQTLDIVDAVANSARLGAAVKLEEHGEVGQQPPQPGVRGRGDGPALQHEAH